ncbi:hypothetical protein MW887_000086 [Aspergillus wentii]|nr:hypothetical protein MW887_000086 [Aspergillus wentii]
MYHSSSLVSQIPLPVPTRFPPPLRSHPHRVAYTCFDDGPTPPRHLSALCCTAGRPSITYEGWLKTCPHRSDPSGITHGSFHHHLGFSAISSSDGPAAPFHFDISDTADKPSNVTEPAG